MLGRRALGLCAVLVLAAMAAGGPAGAGGSTGPSEDDSLRRTGSSAPDDTALRELLSNIPLEHRFNCIQRDPGDATFYSQDTVREAASISAAVTCGPTGDVDFLGYWQFTDRQAMERAHGSYVLTGGNTEDSDDCPADGVWGFDDGEDGKVTCFYATLQGDTTISPTAARVWTDNRNLILGQVSLPEGDDDAFTLRKWWREEAGPLEAPDRTGFTDGPDEDASQALLAQVPKATRKSCEVGDPFEGEQADLRDDRFYVDGYVTCVDPAEGIDSVTYASYDPEIVEDIIEQTWTASEDELDAAGDDDVCPAVGTWSVGKGAKKHDVGTYSCYFGSTATGSPPAWAWTDTEQGILAVASGGDDPDVLHEWWLTDASGPTQP